MNSLYYSVIEWENDYNNLKEQRKRILESSPESYSAFLEEKVRCPYCGKYVRRKDAIITKKSEKITLEHEVTHLSHARTQTKEKYFMKDYFFYRCKECDSTLNQIDEIYKSEGKKALTIGLVVSISFYIICTILIFAKNSVDGFWEVAGVIVFGAWIAYLIFAITTSIVATCSKNSDAKIKSLLKEAGIQENPTIYMDSYASCMDENCK